MSLTGHHMPPRTTQQSYRPRVSDRTMVGTLPPRCLQALPHGTKNAATDGPGYRATPRSTTEPHRGWMSDTYLLHLHAEGEKCFLLTSPFIEPDGKCEVPGLRCPPEHDFCGGSERGRQAGDAVGDRHARRYHPRLYSWVAWDPAPHL